MNKLKNMLKNMKQLDKNPIHLYVGLPCAICDSEQPVSDVIEGCDYVLDKIIAERTSWEPNIIKPILRDISDLTREEAIEAANIVWSPVNGERIEDVEIKLTPIFPHAAIYFKWPIRKSDSDDNLIQQEFALSMEKHHHTIRLVEIADVIVKKNGLEHKVEFLELPIYQSHKLTSYLISRGFNLGILDEGSYIIRNKN